MSQLTSTLKVVIDGSGASSGAAKVSSAINSMSSNAQAKFGAMTKGVSTYNTMINKANHSTANFLKTFLGIAVIGAFINKLAEANRRFSAFIAITKVSTGSMEGAFKSFDYVKDVSNTLGVSLEANLKTFGKFQAAMKPMDASGELTKHIFEGLSVASSGLHLSAMQVELSFKAIEQAASKNKPTLEEFQKQLAEHIPGAMAYLAEGVGLRMDQIHDAISSGTISVKDLLVGFSNVLKQKFGDAAEYAAKQLPGQINRMKNAYLEFMIAVGNKGGAEGFSKVVISITELLQRSNLAEALGTTFKNLGESISNFINNITANDIQKLSAAIKGIGTILVTLAENLGLLFKVIFGAVVFGNLFRFGSFIGTIVTKSRGAATGIGVLRVAFMGLGAALSGPAGLIFLLGSVVALLMAIDKRKGAVIGIPQIPGVEDRLKTLKTSNVADPFKSLQNNGKEQMKQLDIINAYKKIGKESSIPKAVLERQTMLQSEAQLLAKQISGAKATSDIEKLKSQMALPGDTPLGKAGKGSKSKTPKEDKMLDILGDGSLLTKSDSVRDALKDQASDIRDLEKDMNSAVIESGKFNTSLNDILETTKSNSIGDTLSVAMLEIGRETRKTIEELNVFKGVMSGSEFSSALTMIQETARLKEEMARIDNTSAQMQKSQAIISSMEQSLQSQVITGVISESEARIKLKTAIGSQGEILRNNLLPILQEIMTTVSDPAKQALIQANIDKIGEMVSIGKEKTGFDGFTAGIKAYGDTAADVFTSVKDLTTKSFKSMEDSLANFIVTGKFNFKDFAKSIIMEIVRIQAAQLAATAVKGLSSLFAFESGGIMTSSGSVQLKKYAAGGIANSPQMALYGEGSKPEAYVPLPDGRSIPVTMKGNGGGGSIYSTVTVQIQSDGSTKVNREGGNDIANKIEVEVLKVINREKRPGGTLTTAR